MSRESLLYWLTGQSSGTPDSPVNYSGARLQIPESGWFGVVRPWCTGHCSVAHRTVRCAIFSTLKFFAPFFIVSLTEFLYWFVLNLIHL
jgi:hypothetical protein